MRNPLLDQTWEIERMEDNALYHPNREFYFLRTADGSRSVTGWLDKATVEHIRDLHNAALAAPYEYRLEWRRQMNGYPGLWTDWGDAAGYTNKNGGVYTNLAAVKGVITRTKRWTQGYGWTVQFRVLRRASIKPEWKEFGYDTETGES